MIRLTQLAVAKRSVTVLVTIGLLLAGVFSWSQLNQELLPDIQFPYVVVITPLPGASAQDVSTQLTQPIERSIGNAPRLTHVTSSSVNSLSIVVASFSYGTNIKETIATIDTNVKALGLSSSPSIQSFDLNAFPSLIVAIRGTGSTTSGSAERPGRNEHRAVAPGHRWREQGGPERRHPIPPRGQAGSGQAGCQQRLDQPDPGRPVRQ